MRVETPPPLTKKNPLSSSKGHVKNKKGQTKHGCKSATFHDFTHLCIIYIRLCILCIICTYLCIIRTQICFVCTKICASYTHIVSFFQQICIICTHLCIICSQICIACTEMSIIYTHLTVICTQMCIMCTQRQESVNARLLVPLAPAEKSLWSAHADFLCAG